MLDLEARVDLEEVEVARRVHQELEGSGVRVLHRAGGVDDGAAQLAAQLLGERRRRRLFDELLVPPLDRALALAEVHHVAVMVAEHLDLDVARRLDVLLDVDVADAERGLGLALRGLERLAPAPAPTDDAHAAAAAAGDRLDDDREPEVLGDLLSAFSSLSTGPSLPGSIGTPAFFIARRARALSPISRMTFGSGPMNLMWHASHTSARYALSDEEAVARMDGVGARDFGGADDRRHVEIAVEAPRRPDADVLVGEPHVQRVLVGLRVDRHRLDAQLAARADDAKRDLAAVGDQDFLEHGSLCTGYALIANSRSPYCTGWPFST